MYQRQARAGEHNRRPQTEANNPHQPKGGPVHITSSADEQATNPPEMPKVNKLRIETPAPEAGMGPWLCSRPP
jgi:hypothetical protein